MDYNQFEFRNKPTIDEILFYNNLFISGAVGSGKSILLHQIVNDVMAKNDDKRFTLYIHDPKMCEFYNRENYHSIENFVLSSNEKELIKFLSNELARRKPLSMAEIGNETTILFIADDLCCSNLEEFLMSIYCETTKHKIMLILAAQQKKAYLRNKSVLDKGTVFFINDPYGYDYRTIVVHK